MAANISVVLKIHPVLRTNMSATLSESLGASTQKVDCDGTLLGEEELDQSTASTQYRAGNGPWMNILWAGTTGWSPCPCCFLCASDSSVLSLHVYTSLLAAVPSQRWLKVVCFFFFFFLCREWVLKSSLLIAMAVYTYLRLIVDHHGTSQLQVLRQKEVDFCISLLRERVSKSGN